MHDGTKKNRTSTHSLFGGARFTSHTVNASCARLIVVAPSLKVAAPPLKAALVSCNMLSNVHKTVSCISTRCLSCRRPREDSRRALWESVLGKTKVASQHTALPRCEIYGPRTFSSQRKPASGRLKVVSKTLPNGFQHVQKLISTQSSCLQLLHRHD